MGNRFFHAKRWLPWVFYINQRFRIYERFRLHILFRYLRHVFIGISHFIGISPTAEAISIFQRIRTVRVGTFRYRDT